MQIYHEIKIWKWLWNHPWIFLFQNLLFNHPTSHDAVRIKWSVCQSTSVDLARKIICGHLQYNFQYYN